MNTKKVLFYATTERGNFYEGGLEKFCVYDFSSGWPKPIFSGTHQPNSTTGYSSVLHHSLARYLYNNGQPLLSKEWPTTAEEVAKIGAKKDYLQFENIEFCRLPDAEDHFGKPTVKQLRERAHRWTGNHNDKSEPLAPVPADFGK